MSAPNTRNRPYLSYEDNLLVIGNDSLLLGIETNEYANPCVILDHGTGRHYADLDYLYDLTIDGRLRSRRLKLHDFTTRVLPDRSLELTLRGLPDFGSRVAPLSILIFHSFIVPPDRPCFEEKIRIMNVGGEKYKVDNIRFGFRKRLFGTKMARGFSKLKLYSLPFQRYWGVRLDRKHDLFTMSDLVKGRAPAYASEGWTLTDGENGFLVVKHSPELVEFSRLDRKKSRSGVDLTFGGVGLYRGDPEEAGELEPWSQVDFGTTHFELFEGGFEQGCYAFREYMDSVGHVAPKKYRPKIHWNVLYNLDCSLTDPKIKPYSLKQLRCEAELAENMGCETLYLDPQWDTVMGSTVWDRKRLGNMKKFVDMVKKEYGLDLALHLMMNTDSDTEYKGCYRVTRRGKIQKWALRLSMICPPTEWKEIKKKRVARLCEDGASWLMFDFTDYPKGTECWNRDHPHHVPLRRCEHAAGIFEVTSHIKERYPHVCIESHDRIASGTQDYHQMHYQHAGPHTFDEGWAFEMMWDSMGDLISGRAFTLYSYRMCYSLPQYLHFNLSNDNDNLLCFWWYASTVQHIGIGGLTDESSPRYRKAVREVNLYKRLRDFYVDGTFYGIDPTCHVHILPKKNRAVINLFNLTKKTKTFKETIHLPALGLDPRKVKGLTDHTATSTAANPSRYSEARWQKKGSVITLTIDIPPLTPTVLELK